MHSKIVSKVAVDRAFHEAVSHPALICCTTCGPFGSSPRTTTFVCSSRNVRSSRNVVALPAVCSSLVVISLHPVMLTSDATIIQDTCFTASPHDVDTDVRFGFSAINEAYHDILQPNTKEGIKLSVV